MCPVCKNSEIIDPKRCFANLALAGFFLFFFFVRVVVLGGCVVLNYIILVKLLFSRAS